jgi:hypothetical protein
VENLNEFWVLSARLKDLSIIFCTSIKIRPNPNSTADKIKKKKVRESRFKLSNISPIIKEAAYNVIHNNSAVKSKCRAVLTFIAILAIKKKNINIIIFRSPILIIYKINISFTRRCITTSVKSRGSSPPELKLFGDNVWLITEVAKFDSWGKSLVRPDAPAKVTCKI